MNGDTQTRKPRPIFDRRSVFFSVTILVLFAVLVVLILRSTSSDKRVISSAGLTADEMREYANRLKADGLVDQAVNAYEEYLSHGALDRSSRARIYFSVGEMLLNSDRYEDALGYFYKAEALDPDSELKSEIGGYVITCLERLGKGLDAEYQLESRVSLAGEEHVKKAPGETVAKIGIREITMGEINEALEKMPAWVREEYSKDEAAKLEFVQQYVANELLYDKGIKLGVHKDEKIREQIKEVTKRLVVQQVVAEEITGKVKVDPEDVRNHFEAHKSEYRDEARLKFRHILVDSEAKASEIAGRVVAEPFEEVAKAESKDELTKEKGGEVDGWILEGDEIPSVGFDADFSKALFALSVDDAPKVISSAKGFHVVKLIEKEVAREKPFEEVKDQVEYDYRLEKESRLSQELLLNLLKSKDVEIYAEKFQKKGSAK